MIIKSKFLNILYQYYLKYSKKFFDEKINLEIICLIDNLISHLNAGMTLQKSFEQTVLHIQFTKPFKMLLVKIQLNSEQGHSFYESLSKSENEVCSLEMKLQNKYYNLLITNLKIITLKGEQNIRLLKKLKEKIDDDIQFNRKAKTILSQMKLQANIILLSPLILIIILLFISPDHVFIFFRSIFGFFLFCTLCFLNFFGWVFIKKIITI